jgi:DNA-binding PadR family transcriptional regulator
MSTTRMLVLGCVHLAQPVHGYDVRKELLSWSADSWGNVAPGSIYNALKTLTRDGMLEVVDTDQEGARPARTTYRLTDDGYWELMSLVRDAWWNPQAKPDQMFAGLSFMHLLPRAELIAALRQRALSARAQQTSLEFQLVDIEALKPPQVGEMFRLWHRYGRATAEWAEALVERLERGEMVTADDPAWQPTRRSTG